MLGLEGKRVVGATHAHTHTHSKSQHLLFAHESGQHHVTTGPEYLSGWMPRGSADDGRKESGAEGNIDIAFVEYNCDLLLGTGILQGTYTGRNSIVIIITYFRIGDPGREIGHSSC